MSRYEFMARNQDDTEHLARALAERLPSGSVVALDGDLGAGKTTFSKAFGKAMGVEGIINSPTFTIIKEYEGRTRPFFHMDVYRISPAEAEDLGLDEYFYGEGITLVEWAKLIEELLPEERLHITIEHGEGDQRQFRMEPVGKRYEEVCAQLEDLEGWKL
ncbi:tRNA (adenosine(37)-N6)-threonylcarbamoyltransferase complex ATPase subunit type 1 TsaE [Marinicrinis lubricantis]|uniref:tRNA threonylcarbamoyladenosine biosynthesis protein TsaE n=1 Tax=Marinicrinis lubricantis TaxID=2086470 RepID=A0ABW1IRE9_9BACL